MVYNSWPAMKHATPALAATAAAALAATQAVGNDDNFRYKAIYFNVGGTLNVVDSTGVTTEEVTGVAGGIYPCQNCGGVTGGTLTADQFICLYD